MKPLQVMKNVNHYILWKHDSKINDNRNFKQTHLNQKTNSDDRVKKLEKQILTLTEKASINMNKINDINTINKEMTRLCNVDNKRFKFKFLLSILHYHFINGAFV